VPGLEPPIIQHTELSQLVFCSHFLLEKQKYVSECY